MHRSKIINKRDWHGRILPMSPIQRFWANVVVTKSCWIYTDCGDWLGYGRMTVDGHQIRPHRFAYELFIGHIPKGLVIDHLCRNRKCVNPNHLDLVTQRENVLRSPTAPASINARQTHCKRGHPLSGDNIKIYNGRRNCLTCRDEYNAKQRIKRQKGESV